MTKTFAMILLASTIFASQTYYGSTTAPVVLAGAIIKAKHEDVSVKKYKRKDCPVCKGKGWYISGDNITRVNCGYCEPETEQAPTTPKPSHTIRGYHK